jgi:hypothetical protein
VRVLVVGGWKQLLGTNPFSFFFTIYAGEGWTFFTEDECGSDSHSTGRGRGRGRVGGRSQGSALSGGSNPSRTTSSGRSAGEVGVLPVGVGVVKVVCLLQQRDLQGTQKRSMEQFQELVNLDQLPLGRQQNGRGKLPQVMKS